ncbi:hypothetical protein [Streptomyces sp. NPDC057412]|uniref:hypothetical protein n=1 Tax=Streptomyces sp. NPDC057412 TaxID=3346123 RepID=UPI0036B8BB99
MTTDITGITGIAGAALRWGFLGAGAVLLAAFVLAAARRRRDGARFGELAEWMEREWFGAGTVFFAVLAGLAGSWAAAYARGAGGAGIALEESVPVLFPLGVVAAFAARRLTARGDREPLRVKALVLLAAPLPLGALMTGW